MSSRHQDVELAAAILVDPDDYGEDFWRIWTRLNEENSSSNIELVDAPTRGREDQFSVVIRLVPKSNPKKSFKWYLDEFDAWRKAFPSQDSIWPSRKPMDLRNPFERCFWAVVGIDYEADYSVKLFEGKRYPSCEFLKRSFLQYHGSQICFEGDQYEQDSLDSPTRWKKELVELLMREYCENRPKGWKRPESRTGREHKAEGGTICVGVEESLRGFDFFKILEEKLLEQPPIVADCQVPHRLSKMTPSWSPNSVKVEFQIKRNVLESLSNKENRPRVCVLKGTPTDWQWWPKVRFVYVDAQATRLERKENYFVAPDNAFVVWDCIWESVFSASLKEAVRS